MKTLDVDDIIEVLEFSAERFGSDWNVEYSAGFRWAIQIIRNFKEHSPEYKDETT